MDSSDSLKRVSKDRFCISKLGGLGIRRELIFPKGFINFRYFDEGLPKSR
jgi:hypothetical protein